MKYIRRNLHIHLVIYLIVVLMFLTIIPTKASSQNLDEIKILLLNGKGVNEHYITLSSNYGINLTTNDEVSYTHQSTNNESISIQYNRYHLQLIETTSIFSAQSIVNVIKNYDEKKLIPNIEVIDKDGQQYYRVIVGGFDTYDAANDLKIELKDKLSIDSKILGIFNWSIGEFESEIEGFNKVQELRNNGFYGYLVEVFDGDNWVYQVWFGQASTIEEHQQNKVAITGKIPDITLTDASSNNNSYIIQKENGMINNNIVSTNTLLVLSNSIVATVKANEDNSPIRVKERTYQGISNSYWGEISLSLNNDELIVINTLPLETYLYSVVGSEVNSSWPEEALKAQAVAARTFAYSKILYPRSSLYNMYDTTDDQAYYGTSKGSLSIINAVNATSGQVLIRNDKPITAFYSSNAGGITSDGTEVWGNSIPYTEVKPSLWDEEVLNNTMYWYRIVRSNGQTGYVRSDLIDIIPNSTNEFMLESGLINDDNVNFRTGPSIYRFPVITSLPKGEQIVILDIVYENNPYSWIAGPISAENITENVNLYQKEGQKEFDSLILDLKVLERGPSGRVTLIGEGSRTIYVKYPDYYRTLFGGLSTGVQSTLFEIEQTGRVQVLGANGSTKSYVNNQESTYVQSTNNITKVSTINNAQAEYFILDNSNNLRIATKNQAYILHGQGFGHGTGMSQYGMKGMAEAGYNYQEILTYYYKDIEIKNIY